MPGQERRWRDGQDVGVLRHILRNSSAAISCLCFGDEALWQDFRAVFTVGPLRNHTPMQVSRFVAGLEQVPPGLAAARNGRPGWNEVPGKPPGPVCVLAGVARKS